jgi:hypothetical protein
MEMKEDCVNFYTNRSLQEIALMLQDAFAQIKVRSIEEISSGTGPLEIFDNRCDIQVVAQGVDFTAHWAIQVYVQDEGSQRNILLIALGDSGFTRAMGSLKNTISLTKSIKKRDYIASLLN